MVANCVGIIGSVLCAIPQTWIFFLGRAVSGYTAGSFSAVAPTFLRDISPSEISG